MRTFILKRDLPDVEAGAEFTLGKAIDAYYLTSDKTGTKYNCYVYPKDYVEQNKEWFSEKVQKPPLGLIPLWLYNEMRLKNINDAIERYRMEEYDIPQEWIAEKQSLDAYVQGRLKEVQG